MEKCPICTHASIDTVAERTANACEACQSKLGIIPMPSAVRRGPCGHCGGRKFLRAIPREHTMRDKDGPACAPMFVTHAPRGYRGAMVRAAKELDIEQGYGRLEVYACFGCGAVQWYCVGIESIPIHPNLMTEIVEEPE